MSDDEKAAAFDVLVLALTNRWHDGSWSADCSFMVDQPTRETRAECVPDLMAWAARWAKARAKLGGGDAV